MRSNRVPEALEYADRALTIAEPLNLVRIVADAMNNRAAALSNVGRRREGTALLEAAVRLAAEGGWTDLELRLRNNLAVTVSDDDPLRAFELSREIRDIASRIGDVQWYLLGAAGSASGDVARMVGWESAVEAIDEAATRAPIGSLTWIQLVTLLYQIGSWRGEDVGGYVERLEASNPTGHSRWWVDSVLGDSILLVGDNDRAAALLETCLESGLSDQNEPIVLAGLALAQLANRDATAARRTAGRLRDGVFQGPTAQAYQAVADAGALALEGRSAEARARFEHGLGELRRLAQLHDVSRWEVIAVSLLPDAPEARSWAAEARELFERTGARALLGALDAASAEAGPRPAPSAAPSEAVTERS
jgi:hypothetical protein